MQQPSRIPELIRLLRHFGARPGLYIMPVDVQNALSFLGGVNMCVWTLSESPAPEEKDSVVLARGWQVFEDTKRRHLDVEMRDRGMSEMQIIKELAEIEAVALERKIATIVE